MKKLDSFLPMLIVFILILSSGCINSRDKFDNCTIVIDLLVIDDNIPGGIPLNNTEVIIELVSPNNTITREVLLTNVEGRTLTNIDVYRTGQYSVVGSYGPYSEMKNISVKVNDNGNELSVSIELHVYDDIRIRIRNFDIVEDLDFKVENENLYPSYRKTNITLSDQFANETIRYYFGDVIDNNTIVDKNNNRYGYRKDNVSYSILVDGEIRYYNYTRNPSYSYDEIRHEDNVYNTNESKLIIETSIITYFNVNMSEYGYYSSHAWKMINRSGEHINSYVLYYKQTIFNNIMTYGDHISHFGRFYIKMSPNANIISICFLDPLLAPYQNTTLTDLSMVLKNIDNDFEVYKKELTTGYSNYTLFDVDIAYGYYDGIVRVGWILYFYCGDDEDCVSTIFIP